MDKATERPWQVVQGTIILNEAHEGVTDLWQNSPRWDKKKAWANADLIVKAVNRDHLFDELVEALSSYVYDPYQHDFDCPFYETQDPEAVCNCKLQEHDALIARAEGKEGEDE